ncbi:MAG: hypothetical protein ACI4OB_07000 [Christensenellales bacterium]
MAGTIQGLLESLEKFHNEACAGLSFPVVVKSGDSDVTERSPEFHKMRLPNPTEYRKYAPYVIGQFVTSRDIQKPGESTQIAADIRLILCVYDSNEQTGALRLVNLIDTYRIALLKKRVLDGMFVLDTEAGLESIAYPQDTTATGPYYAGEIAATFIFPSIEREIFYG